MVIPHFASSSHDGKLLDVMGILRVAAKSLHFPDCSSPAPSKMFVPSWSYLDLDVQQKDRAVLFGEVGQRVANTLYSRMPFSVIRSTKDL
jgi:hypothetical protein